MKNSINRSLTAIDGHSLGYSAGYSAGYSVAYSVGLIDDRRVRFQSHKRHMIGSRRRLLFTLICPRRLVGITGRDHTELLRFKQFESNSKRFRRFADEGSDIANDELAAANETHLR